MSSSATVFTIEQVDLIRRLRRTGMALDKLVYAYKGEISLYTFIKCLYFNC